MTTQTTTTSSPSPVEAPRFENGKAMLVAGLRDHFAGPSVANIPAQWERLLSFSKISGQVGAVHYGLCFLMSHGFDYLSGVEVSDAKNLPAEFSSARIPAQRYAIFAHRDHVSKLRNKLDAIWHKWFATSGYEPASALEGAPNFFERYGEKFDPKSGTGDIEVWIPIQPKGGNR